jgi:hypothetical protein
MRVARILCFSLAANLLGAVRASADDPRQYYDSMWTYSESDGYYYVYYYYKPTATQTNYDDQLAIYEPSRPNYIYYYNRLTRVIWGRYEIGSKGDPRFSVLAEKDCKRNIKDIPDSAFPAPGKVPTIPGAKDEVAMEPPPENVPKEKK